MRGSRSTFLLVLVVALVATLGLTGCGTDTDAARAVVQKIQAPAAGWTAGGPRIDAYGEGIDEDGRIWVVDDSDGDGRPDDDPSYLASWQVVVAPGQEQQRCTEAADWLQAAGEKLPGQKVDAAAGRPDPAASSAACLQVLKPLADGSSSDTGYASWPATEKHGYRFSAALAATTSGSRLSLSVSVEVGPTSRYGS